MGAYCVFPMIEYADDCHVTDKEYNDPVMQDYLKYGAKLIVLANDLGSFEKEYRQDKRELSKMFNNVAVNMALTGCDENEGLIRTVKLIQHYEQKAKDFKDILLSRPDFSEDSKIFVEGCEILIGGNLQVSLILTRYVENIEIA